MLLVQGSAGETTLTGSIYEPGEDPPSFRGSPDAEAPYVLLCDDFYAVDSGGTIQHIDGREVNVAFESPILRGFDTRSDAIDGATTHIRTQFARIGLAESSVTIEVTDSETQDTV